VKFRSLTESIDTSGATGRLVFHVLAALAEFERALIIERTLAGKAAAKARGRFAGAPRLYGFTSDRTELVPEEVELIQEATRRVIEGESFGTIMKDWRQRGLTTATGSTWQTTQLRRVLLNPQMVSGGVLTPDEQRRLLAATADKAGASSGARPSICSWAWCSATATPTGPSTSSSTAPAGCSTRAAPTLTMAAAGCASASGRSTPGSPMQSWRPCAARRSLRRSSGA
jgi:hypothetical protein